MVGRVAGDTEWYLEAVIRPSLACALLVLSLATSLAGCSHAGTQQILRPRHKATGPTPELLAVYEAWWGHPSHIKIGYLSNDPVIVRKQIASAKSMGITGFVVDWYGYREPLEDKAYALLQSTAALENFHIAMMYDESNMDEGATDEAIEEFKLFNKSYLAMDAPGRSAYLTYENRPVIFVFPKGKHTDWNRVRAELNKWQTPPLLIDEYPPNQYNADFDGYYAWVSPGPQGWKADGSNWGQQYLEEFYSVMQTKYPDKIAIGGAWPRFDDSRASWGLNRHMSARCGQTFADTYKMWRNYYPADAPLPFLLVETWNDYEEGTAVERGLANITFNDRDASCGAQAAAAPSK